MKDKNLIGIQKHWEMHASTNLSSIDWLGEEVTRTEITFKINTARDLIKELTPLKRPESKDIFGIAIEDSLDNLALGIALILEGVTHAIIPIDATETQFEDLCVRYQVTILATSKSISNSEKWKQTAIETNKIKF